MTTLDDAIRQAADPAAVLRRIVDQAVLLIPHADGASLEMRRDDETLEYVCASGTLGPFLGLRLAVHGSMSGLAALTGEIQQCDDTRSDPRVDAEACRRTGVGSMLCVPLTGFGDVAVLKVSCHQPHAFSAGDAVSLRRLTHFVEVALSAASDLANVTAEVLAQDSEDGGAARFLAEVLAPGLAADVAATDRVSAAIREHAIDIVVQPILALDDRRLLGVEALSRFAAEPRRGPDLWFEEAARVGLRLELELLAIELALAEHASLPADCYLGVNASPDTILSEGFTTLLAPVAAVRPLVVEVTEHARILDYDAMGRRIEELRAIGVRIAVDDTGSGYASLRHILRLRPDTIKLDRALVNGIDADPVKQALAAALVRFASDIGAAVIAEGIETDSEDAAVRALGVQQGQGYLYARPAPVGELVRHG